jgi:hypothetical protein
MRNISIRELTSVFGYPMLSDTAQHVLVANGFKPESKLKQLKDLGVAFLEQKEHGVSLDYCSRETFLAEHGSLKEEGEVILRSLFIYPNGSKTYQPFTSPVDFGIDGITSRADANKKLGKSFESQEDDGEIEWESWMIDGLLVTAFYKSNGISIKNWNISAPKLS